MITVILYWIFGSIAVLKLKLTWLTVCWFSVIGIDLIITFSSLAIKALERKYR